MTPNTEKLKELLEKATDGRWESMATADLSLFVVRDGNDGEELIASVNTCNPHDANLLALAPALAARVVALEAEVKRLRGAQWKPIETAPKDGTVVFVWHVTRANPYACFDSNVKKARYLPDLEEWQVENVGGNIAPVVTHWMPLPPAPKEGDA